MGLVDEKFEITGVSLRSAYLFLQLMVLHFVAVIGSMWGAIGLPIVAPAFFLAVYATLRQVEG